MALPANRALCQVCAYRLVRNGTTRGGRTRWRCKHCGASTTRTRTEITAAAQFNTFHTWLLGTTTQTAHGGTGRSFRAATAWCRNITVPPIEPTGVIADQVMVDGTYFNGWCVLIAFNTTHVIDWQWCDREKHTTWTQLLNRIPAPQLVIVDGGTGIHTTLRDTCTQTPVQRCYFHILQTVCRHTTYQPRTTPGREILALTRALIRVTTTDQASGWLSEYSGWEHQWDEFLKQRSYPPHRRAQAHRRACEQVVVVHPSRSASCSGPVPLPDRPREPLHVPGPRPDPHGRDCPINGVWGPAVLISEWFSRTVRRR